MLKPLDNTQSLCLSSNQKEVAPNKIGDVRLFSSGAEKVNSTQDLDKLTQEFSVKVEKAEKDANVKMEKAIKTIKEKMTENAIEQIIAKKLNSKVDDLSAISFNPINIADSQTEGLFSIHNNITQDGVSVEISLFKSVSADSNSIPDELKKQFFKCIELNQNIIIKIPQNLLAKKAKDYLKNNNHMSEIQKMKPGESIVLEETHDSQHIPVVTASKDKNGNVILDIDKNGMKVRISISQEELNKSVSEKSNTSTSELPKESNKNPFDIK
ncbi:MAG TPA: hypothetical protein DDW90_10240 [Cyanobacteria bacterium UBA9971]|nr:hypothetical protein [Cyanobacteria bacterium UBA9971]